ncbi:MAG: DUF1295 domain-containing protein [Nitrospirales bacterium]|nr:DUF1295 domain-containing protein [Nitrospirales bacterium]
MAPFPWYLLTLPYFDLLLVGLSVLMGVLWLLHLRVKNASLADAGFCLGLVWIIAVCGLMGEGHFWRRILVVGMGSVYAFRLGWHVMRNRVWRKVEDPRYEWLRSWLGQWEPVGFLGYFVLQIPGCVFFGALLCWVMAHPQEAVRGWDLLAISIFLLAIAGETVADRQLERFRADSENRGKVLREGLWRYSRHPNYFFEFLHWCAYVPLAVGLSWAGLAPVWPLLMLVFLLWITGVPLAEVQALKTRGKAYRAYQRTTNRLFPWMPRRNS